MPFLSDLTPSFVDGGCLSATLQGPDACLLVHFLQSYFVLAPLSICNKSVVHLLSRITAAQRLCDGSVPPLQQGLCKPGQNGLTSSRLTAAEGSWARDFTSSKG